MCLVIDTCCIATVFNSKSKHHSDFSPVLKWVRSGSGRMIYGGRKYKKELSQMTEYVKIINQLAKAGRVIELNGRKVDSKAAELKAKIPDDEFDDEHLVAILLVSKCKVVCTDDKRAHPYLQRADLYPPGKRPKIYKSKSHSSMCCTLNVAPICK